MHNARQIGNNGGGRGGKGCVNSKPPPRATERAPLLYRAEPSFLFHPLALPLPRSFHPLFIRHILFSPFDKRVSTRPPCPFAPLPALSCSSTLAGCGFYVSGLIKRFAPPSLPLTLSLSADVSTVSVPTTPY